MFKNLKFLTFSKQLHTKVCSFNILKMKIKVIQINSFSHSFIKMRYEEDIFRNWYSQVGVQIKKASPNLNVECWTPEKEYKKEKRKKYKGVKFRIFPSTFAVRHGMDISFAMLNAFIDEQKNLKDDEKLIIHFHGYHSWQVYLILLFLNDKKNIKIIAQHHGGRSPFQNMKKYKRMALFLPIVMLMQFCEHLLFKKINTFYSLSDNETKYLEKLAPKSKKIFQTMGLKNELYKQINKSKIRKKLGLDINKKYILFLGRVKTTKGIKDLLDAMKKITRKDINLLIIGEGSDYEKYKMYVKEKEIKNSIFLGAKFLEEKIEYLAASDCLILPSHTEGAPVVIMEALAQNLPVIATRVGGIPKMIRNNKEGIFIDTKSPLQIINAINNILTWKKKNLRKYANKYKWDRVIKNTLEEYYETKR